MLKMAPLYFLLVICIIGYSDELKMNRRMRKHYAQRKMMSIDEDVQRMKTNLTNLWNKFRHLRDGNVKPGPSGGDGVSVSITGMEGEEMYTSYDNTGTHVHVHMHLDTEVPSDEFMKKHHWHRLAQGTALHARCNVRTNPSVASTVTDKITGSVFFRQKIHKPLEVRVDLQGFDTTRTDKQHGFHVHMYGDDTSGCKSYGGHFNPDGMKHGGPKDKIRHVGDWGNILQDSQGEAHATFTDVFAQLIGPHSILGRGIVIHEHNDDLGRGTSEVSNTTGNAGGRLACCVIVWSAEKDWETLG